MSTTRVGVPIGILKGVHPTYVPLPLSPHELALVFGVLDVTSIVLPGFLPHFFFQHLTDGAALSYAAIALGTAVLHLAVSILVRAYHPSTVLSGREAVWRGAVTVCLTFGILLTASALTKVTADYSRIWFFGWAATSLTVVTLQRACTVFYLEKRLAKGACLARALLVTIGPGDLDAEHLALCTQNRTRALVQVQVDHVGALTTILPNLTRLYQPDAVILELPWEEVPKAAEIAQAALQDVAVDVRVVPILDKKHAIFLRMTHLGCRPIFDVSERPLTQWNASLKRAEDIVISLVALFISFPLMVLIAAAIYLESRGPILFRQLRIGFNGSNIEVWKFRTMYVEKTDANANCQTCKGDRRVTRIGRFLRKTSLDELPQFFNVLQGRMSVVGPRPHPPKITAGGHSLVEADEHYPARHRVKPGITGWAQVNGNRGELDSVDKFRRRLEYDIKYIEHWSIWLDLKIILMTVLRIYDPKAY